MADQLEYAIDGWDPEYGSSVGAGMDESDAQLDLDVEQPEGAWAPQDGAGPAASDVVFVDGVRRIDARVWAIGQQRTRPALAVSVAAGAVRCTDRARIVATEVRRVLVGPAGLNGLESGGLRYRPLAATGEDEAAMIGAVQQYMGTLEAQVADDLPNTELLVVDGPLTSHSRLRGAVGYVKTHRTTYLPDTVEPIVRRLDAGQRTPVFLLKTTWQRWSWYLRLPGGVGHPWAGVVRVEAQANLDLAQVVAVADMTAATLPRFASPRHRDARAPANLLPIAGLEDQLHHRLGSRDLVVRRLRQAAAKTAREVA